MIYIRLDLFFSLRQFGMPSIHFLNSYCRFCKPIKVNADIPKEGETDIQKPNGSWFIAAKQSLLEMRLPVSFQDRFRKKANIYIG